MLSIATLFDDEQRLLNRVWIVLLGLEALLVLFGTISAVVRGVVAIRRRRPGGLRRADSNHHHHHGRPRRVTIELPATGFEIYDDGRYDGQYSNRPVHVYPYSDVDHYDDKDYYDGHNGQMMTAEPGMYAEHDIFYTDEKFWPHTPTRAQTPTRILNSPSQKV
ncbi:hypothetical protein Sste5346_009842 [Sporothrix stenoceras]|uniref:Integral membrane protein n=1 Tax=Sporothrix stenoceras TaxID=5173 RepID=A0ABR3YIR6_9PEZI